MRRRLALVVLMVGGVLPFVVPPASATTATITVSVSPASPHVGAMPTVSGTTSGIPEGQTLTIQRDDPNGTTYGASMPVDASGAYTFTDPTAAVRGQLTYTVTWIGDSTASASWTKYVTRIPSAVTISAGRSIVTTGHTVHLAARLKTPEAGTISIRATPYGGSSKTIASGSETSGTALTASPTVRIRTRYTVHFAGDATTYAPSSASVVVRARGMVREHLYGGYATRNGVRLYHASAHPKLVARLIPGFDNVCLRFVAQRRYGGAWHTVASRCVYTDSYGRAVGYLTGTQKLFSPYRIRAQWPGSKKLAARNGAWLKIQFR